MGRRLCIFLSLAETPDNHTIRGLTDPDPTGPATYKENSTIQGFKSNRLQTIHPLFLRHQTRRKHVQGRPELFQLTHPQCRSIQPDSLQIKRPIFLTDEELYSVICSYINKEYSVKTPAQLSGQQKIDTARHMHFNYNASNQQLRRLLRLDMSILEELFP